MQLTFLSGHKPLTKEFTTTGVSSYPLVKNMTSTAYFIPASFTGIQQKARLLQEHADKGDALLKGELIRPLINEPRKGLTDKEKSTQNIIIDIDGLHSETLITTPLNKIDITNLAAQCVALLPEEFQDTSYIVHASSSLGMKGQKISMHLDFLLSKEVSSDFIKRWLQLINFNSPTFDDQLSLSATGTALCYKVDTSLADNSRIVYIATPIFTGVTNPIPNNADRIFLVDHEKLTVTPPENDKAMSRETLAKVATRKINVLRDAKGLAPRKEHITAMRFDGVLTNVVTNPDRTEITEAWDDGSYVRYNVASGDSNAYYVHKFKPQVMRNFKGEPNFLFEQADSDAYQKHIEKYVRGNAAAEEEFEPEPIAFRDRHTDSFFTGTVNKATNTLLSIYKTHRAGITDWFGTYNHPEPENITVMDYVFAPTDPRTLDLPQHFINQYSPSPLMSTCADIDENFKNLNVENALNLGFLCPNIFKVLRSVTGNGDKELLHFLNWFSYIVCTKQKTQTAWVFHGTEGTGKGVLFAHILRPILGENFAVQIRMENLDEQFNNWMEKALLVMVDEFSFNSAKNKRILLEKLRNYITEPVLTIRGMRENVRSVNNYSNFMLCGNQRDMLRTGEDDRRYNICNRQEQKLFVQFPELRSNLHLLAVELPLFASAMMQFDYSEQLAHTNIDNDAKRAMRDASQTVVEDFMAALRTGNLEFFIQIMDMDDDVGLENFLPSAKNAMRSVLSRHENGERIGVYTSHLFYLFQTLVGGSKMSQIAFAKLLSREGFITERYRIGETQARGIAIKFTHPEIETLKKRYLINYVGNVTPIRGDKPDDE